MQTLPARQRAWLSGLFCAISVCCSIGLLGSPRACASQPLGPPPPPREIVADNSLSIDEYVKLGVTPLDRPWTVVDYDAAFQTLEELAKKDITKVPRYGSQKSGKLFQRLCQGSELLGRIMNDRSLPEAQRREKIRQSDFLTRLTFYYDETKQFDNEQVELAVAACRLFVTLKRFKEKQLKTLPKDAPQRPQVIRELDGYQGMASGMFVFGTLQRLGLPPAHDPWRPQALARYLVGLKEMLPDVLADLPAEYREQFATSLDRKRITTPHRLVSEALAELLAALPLPEMAPDNSLSVAEYARLGMPPVDRTWSQADYSDAVDVLKKLAEEDCTRLPRHGSVASGRLFSRMANLDNLLTFMEENRSLPPRQRDIPARAYLGASSKAFFDLYARADKRMDREEVELLLLMGRQLAAIERLPGPHDRLSPASSPGAGELTARAIVHAMFKPLWPAYFCRQRWRAATRLRFFSGLEALLPKLLPHCPPDFQEKCAAAFRGPAARETDPQVLAGIRRLLELVPAREIVPDRSLSVQQYVALGVPPLERAWSYKDCAVAYKVLRDLPKEQLPRYGSKTSGKLFKRMCSIDNFTAMLAANESLPPQQRLRMEASCMSIASLTLAELYQGEGKQFDNEEVELLLLAARQMLVLKDSRSRAAGTTVSIIGIGDLQTHRSLFRPIMERYVSRWRAAARRRYLTAMKTLVAKLFDPPPRRKIEPWRLMIANEPDAQIRASMQAVLDAIPERAS